MLIILVGLPGSGKTWYAQNVLKYDYFIDDPKGFFDFPTDVNGTIVIADPHLCSEHLRAKSILPVMYPKHSIKWIFFENNPEKCRKNVEYRSKNGDNRNVLKCIEHLTKLYTIPDGSEIIEIWNPK